MLLAPLAVKVRSFASPAFAGFAFSEEFQRRLSVFQRAGHTVRITRVPLLSLSPLADLANMIGIVQWHQGRNGFDGDDANLRALAGPLPIGGLERIQERHILCPARTKQAYLLGEVFMSVVVIDGELAFIDVW